MNLLESTLVHAQPIQPPKASMLLQGANVVDRGEGVGVKTRGMIRRTELNQALRGGVPHLLAQARLSPARRGGRFFGFTLSELRPSSLAERAGFRAGDIIMSVNDEPIGRPEQMMHVLSILPFSPTLVIRFERKGVIKEWTWLVRD